MSTDIIHLINSAATGQTWARSKVASAWEAAQGTQDNMPDFSEMSISDEDLKETLTIGLQELEDRSEG